MSSGGGSMPNGNISNASSEQNTPLSEIRSPIQLNLKDIIKDILNAEDDELEITDMKGGHKYVWHASIRGENYNRIFKILHKTEEDVKIIDKEVEIYRQINAFPEEDKKYFFQGVSGRLSNEDNKQYDFPGYAILNMPYMEGVDLHKFLTNKPTLKQIYKILKQVAKALLVLLQNNISHGDVWPGNIFVLDTGDIQLFDFDSAGSPKELIKNPTTGKNITRLKYNTIGVNKTSYQRGLFPMCKMIFTYLNEPSIVKELEEYNYLDKSKQNVSIHDADNIYRHLIKFFRRKENSQGGRRRKTKKVRRTRLRRTRVA